METPAHILPVSWRGSVSIHAAAFYSNRTWPLGMLHIGVGEIHVSSPRGRISLTPGSVIELRMFRLPFPAMEVVFRDGKEHVMLTFSVLRYRRLKQLLEAAGFGITATKLLYTGWDMAERSERFGLLQRGGD